MKRLAYIWLVVGGFLALGLSQGMANRAVEDLATAENVRTSIVKRNLDHLPNTYDIFTKLNDIDTKGPVATPQQQRVIVLSVMTNALLVVNLQALMAQYLSKDHNPATLSTRMAYLAISTATNSFREHGIPMDKQKGIDAVTRKNASILKSHQDLFREQLAAFYDLAQELWGKSFSSWKEPHYTHRRQQSEGETYPKFYRDILHKINSSAQKPEGHQAYKKVAYIKGDAFDVIEWFIEQVGQQKDYKSQARGARNFIRTIAAYGLATTDMDTLMKMFALREHEITGYWNQIKQQAVAKENTKKKKASIQKQEEPNLGDWTGIFETNIGTIVHRPDAIDIGGIKNGKEIYISKDYGGDVLKAPLILKVNSTLKQFVAAIAASGITMESTEEEEN